MAKITTITKKIYIRTRKNIIEAPLIRQVIRFVYDTYERKVNAYSLTHVHATTEKGWSVVVITDGKNRNDLQACLSSIENELHGSPYEIIVVGPAKLELPTSLRSVRHIHYKELPFGLAPGWITRKKNIGVFASQYDKVVLCHDYVTFKTGWKEGFERFGNAFDVAINRVSNPDGSRHRDWLTWDYPGIGATLLPYDQECTPYQYLSGTYFVVKRQFYLQHPLDEKLRWGEGEDVAWSKEIRPHTTFVFNPHSEVVYTKLKVHQPGWLEKSIKLKRMLEKVASDNKGIKIDVIIPVYNGSTFIIKAIESAATQTIPPQKIIVVNDGSTDTTEEIILDYKQQCKVQIDYVKIENGGPSKARNIGIGRSTSDFLAFLDADDKWLPHKLEKQLEVLNTYQNTNIGLIYCAYEEIDQNDNLINQGLEMKPLLRGYCAEKLLEGNFISGGSSGVLIRRKAFENLGLFDETLRGAEDWDMWIRIAEEYEIDFTTAVSVQLRTHPDHSQSNKKLMYKNEISFYNKWVKILLEKGRGDLIPRLWATGLLKRALKRLPLTDFFWAFRHLKRETKIIFLAKILWIKK